MNKTEILRQLKQIFRDVFDDDTLEICDEMCADDIGDWDSLAQIDLIAASEAVFSIKFSIDDITRLKNVGDMIDTIERKLT